ncbi:DJ-1/PfpI family protein [Halococcus hamelinensis]|uniref:AraC family transcriptional regulator n=1 Tax=Halococcus hamelinensis 100A6 TaxID=1132509 RepID=M0M0G6_9EURY|nr:DJ-1/PfpI family protein [Halococcus hamelinensis]EMA39307.1 AraC family transcriptional regulator [Halococcus hamelinensis 100A6]
MDASTIESVAVVLYDGFDELDAIAPYEVFATAADHGAAFDVSLRTLESVERVTASHGTVVEPDGSLDGLDPDLVVVPGGGWNDRADRGAWAQSQGALPEKLVHRHRDGTTIAAVCTGGMILAAAGLLDGRPATTHHGALADLRDTDAAVVDARVVDAGDVLTAGGITSGLDLALWLVEREASADIAEAVADELEYERSGEVHRSA